MASILKVNVNMPAASDMKYIDGELWVRVPDCPECKRVHATFPNVRSFHSPCCARHGQCAQCNEKLPYRPDAQFGYEIGALCERCAS